MGLKGPLGRPRAEKVALGLRDRSRTIVMDPLRQSWEKRAQAYDTAGDTWLNLAARAAKLDQAKRYAELAFRAHEISDRIWYRLGRTADAVKRPSMPSLSERPGA